MTGTIAGLAVRTRNPARGRRDGGLSRRAGAPRRRDVPDRRAGALDWAPDGGSIAFSLWASDGFEGDLALRAADGTRFRLLTDGDPGFDGPPAWSPDGSRVLFLRTVEQPATSGRFRTLHAVRPDGSEVAEIPVTFRIDRGLDWQPRCTIRGTRGDDDLVGTDGRDVICGGAGNDRIRALGGDDVVFGGPGDDRVFGGEGDGVVVGDAGADRLAGGPGEDLLNARDGQRGNDVVWGGAGRDECHRNRGDLALSCTSAPRP